MQLLFKYYGIRKYSHFQLNMQNNIKLILECTHYEMSKFLIGSDVQGMWMYIFHSY